MKLQKNKGQNMKDLLQKFTSRKFILAVLSATVVFCNAMFDWGITTDQVIAILAPILAYIGVEGIADIKER